MKLAVITDSSAYLPQDVLHHDDLFILEIPIYIDGESYVEGKNLTHDEFYQKMADNLPKSEPFSFISTSISAIRFSMASISASMLAHSCFSM